MLQQMKQIIPTLLKILQKLDVQQFSQDALSIMEILLSDLPEDNKLFSTKDFTTVLGMYKNDLQVDVDKSQLHEQAKTVYKQYAAMQGATEKVAHDLVQSKKEEDSSRRKSSLGQCEEKENGATDSPRKSLTKASPPPRPRRVLRSNNAVNA